jgi:hypothetical protein
MVQHVTQALGSQALASSRKQSHPLTVIESGAIRTPVKIAPEGVAPTNLQGKEQF